MAETIFRSMVRALGAILVSRGLQSVRLSPQMWGVVALGVVMVLGFSLG